MPEGWAWCRLGELFYHTTGKALKKSNNKGSLRKYITTSNLYWNKFDFTEIREMYFTNDELDKCTIKKGDLVLCNGGDVGRAAIWNFDEDICYQNHVSRLRPKIIGINNKLYLYLLMFYKEQGMLNAKGVGITSLSANDLLSGLFPLPPINEQDQIVIKIENIFSQIDYIDDNKSDLQTAINKTKSKILDLAIHGKLVPQDPNDEPAEELLKHIATSDNRPYEKIEEGDIPFEIPPSWKWTTIKNIVNYIGDGDWIESKDQSDKGIRLIQTGNIGFGTFKDKEGKYHYISENTFSSLGCNEIFEGDILISRLPEPVGRACILPKVPERMITAVDCTIIRLNEELFQKELFVYYTISNKYLELIKENCTGTTRLRISRSNLEKIFIPIPPLNEQKRILNRIKKLFETLDEIILNLV
ncbi:MAG: restriction endonuclease subunit S [Treponema sp.]|nr:restriction endonuclease subunit S [Treponema sp.]